MNRKQYVDICKTTLTGKNAFVHNALTGEEGMVKSCTHEHLLVKTREGKDRCWDYHRCERPDRS